MVKHTLQTLSLITSLLMIPAAYADFNTDGVTNPECLSMLAKIDTALNQAHARNEFKMITINPDVPVNLGDDMCNVNFVIELKDKKEIADIQGRFLKYMSSASNKDLTRPESYKIKEL
ncbi:hypothetical protein GR140_18895 [Pseudomonas putida]|uniref:hypothetical protein n=1 Tax=Pseudomonas putida TaxID=303 RepID=UPI001BB08ACF|nr:hypothetical protein [Pseudomonas putida]QUG90733.1 hypothetical protein GR140_18895 [Pseudomonas putida]